MIELDEPCLPNRAIVCETIQSSTNNNTRENITEIETIEILDEVPSSLCTQSENNNVIVIDETPQRIPKCRNESTLYKNIYEENRLFGKIIDKCLELENSDGMTRIINRTLLKYYEESDEVYKKSSELQRVLRKTMKQLEDCPDKKFSHLKNICETLKLHKAKKRVQLTTLTNDLTDPSRKRHREFRDFPNGLFKKPKNIEVIDLDDDTTDVLPVINLDDDEADDKMEVDAEKENQRVENQKNDEQRLLVPIVEVTWDPSNVAGTVESKEVPPDTEANDSVIDKTKIQMIESTIALYKNMIKVLEEKEVDDDTAESPYIQSEKLKAKIVSLYKELCELTGHEAIKQRIVRLQVLKGHPPGPLRELESFINSNIGSNGEPPFPDFRDVVECVIKANEKDGLGWSKAQIMREASALFTQCGRALQKRRQQREWRDLMTLVKMEPHDDDDPANEDPALLARLEENRRIAHRKETELLERYTMMQNLPPQTSQAGPSSGINLNKRYSNTMLSNSALDGDSESEDSDLQSVDDNASIGTVPCNEIDKTTIIPSNTLSCDTVCKVRTVSQESFELDGTPATETEICDKNDNTMKTDLPHAEGNNHIDNNNINNEVLNDPIESALTQTKDIDNVGNLGSAILPNTDSALLQIDGSNLVTNDNISKLLKNLVESDPIPRNDSSFCQETVLYNTVKLLVKTKESDLASEKESIILPMNGDHTLKTDMTLTDESNFNKNNIENITKLDGTAESDLLSLQKDSFSSITASSLKQTKESNENHESDVSKSTNSATNLPDNSVNDIDMSLVKVKKEPIDIQKLLEDLGDNYTMSIVEIEDPFFVIEISSDSSDDEENEIKSKNIAKENDCV